MISIIAPIATNLLMSKFGGQSKLPQTQLKEPPNVDLYRKFDYAIAVVLGEILSRLLI